MTVLEDLLAWTGQLVESAGSLGLGAVMAAEAVLPIPSEVVLPVVGVRVSSGELAFIVALLATTAGSVLGSGFVYGLARWGGRRWVTRLNRLLGVTDERWDRTQRWFARRGALVVLLGRLVPGVRCLVSLPAGSLRMPLPRFLAATAAGSALWNAAWIGAGTRLTASWNAVATAADGALTAVPPAALTAVVACGALLLLGRTPAAVLLARTASRFRRPSTPVR